MDIVALCRKPGIIIVKSQCKETLSLLKSTLSFNNYPCIYYIVKFIIDCLDEFYFYLKEIVT